MSRFVGASTRDLVERLSRSSYRHEGSTGTSDEGMYEVAETPVLGDKTEQARSEALVIVTAWDRRWLGLAVHNIAAGVVSTALPLAVYPFMTCNLNMEGTQTLSVRMLLVLPLALKPFLMVMVDCFPSSNAIGRRRPWLALGWIIAAAALVRIYFISQPDPYFRDRKIVGTAAGDLTASQLRSVNDDAPSKGALYALFMVIATSGYVVADVAADGLTRQVTAHHLQRTEFENGLLSPLLVKLRTTAMLTTFPFMGVAMSGWDYGGDFDFTLEFTQVMLIVGVVALLPVPLVWTMIDEKASSRLSIGKYARGAWRLLRDSASSQVLMIRFISAVFNGFSSIAVNPVAFYYAGVQPLNDNVVSFVAAVVVLFAVVYVEKKGWNLDYRIVIIAATCIVLALDCGATLFTIWGVVRSQWFWIGLPVMEAIPSALDYVILTELLAELAEPDMQLLGAAVVSAVATVGGALGLALSKHVGARFDVSNAAVMRDSPSVRAQLSAVFLLAYAAQAAAVASVAALPRHAADARERRKRREPSTPRALALAALLLFGGALAAAVHALSVADATACLAIAAGTGC